MTTTRREVLASFTLGGAALALPELRPQGQGGAPKPGAHAVKPLPFDPTKLQGLP
jgi:hypothetical protein